MKYLNMVLIEELLSRSKYCTKKMTVYNSVIKNSKTIKDSYL